jgi:ubiquinone biosynthesis protein
LARDQDSIFHADPHAGNLLYDKKSDQLVILDWALTERLTRAQRKNVLILIMMMGLRDSQGIVMAIDRLRHHTPNEDAGAARLIREHVARFLDGLKFFQVPGAMDAMRLLDAIALEGIRFPAALLMFRKASFTLEGVLEDIAGPNADVDTAVARHAWAHWVDAGITFFSLLAPKDWLALDWSALTFTSRLGLRTLKRAWRALPSLTPQVTTAV